MYIGRYLVVGPGIGAYRVSSRSFPNRQVIDRGDALTVVPTEAAEPTDNPYVSYNCLRPLETATRDLVAFGNGSHVDPIAEKLELGYPARDALALSLLALDFEKDDYDTPRIAATIDTDGTAVVGTVRRDGLVVQEVEEPTLVATYERDSPDAVEFEAATAAEAAATVMDQPFEHAVCAAGVTIRDDGIVTAISNGQS